MPELTKPDLEQLYHEAGLRTSKTHNPESGELVVFDDNFYSFADFKREVQAPFIVAFIAAIEALKQALQAFAELLIAGVRLATLDGRGFNNLGRFFVHVGNAIALAFQGAIDVIASGLSIYFRTLWTFVEAVAYAIDAADDALVALLDYEEPVVEFDTTTRHTSSARVVPSAPREEVVPSAPSAARGIYPSLPSVQQSSAGRFAFYPAAPVAPLSLLKAQTDLEQVEGLSEAQRTQIIAQMATSGQYLDDRNLNCHFSA